MTPEIYMWDRIREHILGRHDAYVEAVQQRVFPLFGDIDSEAERFADGKYEELMSLPCWDGDTDPSAIAEVAQDAGIEKYVMLAFLKHEMYLGSLAGLYHVWERGLREFLERELKHWMEAKSIEKSIWKSNIGDVFALLASFGWDPREEKFYKEIDACRLIVNVYKHGKGNSVEELASKYPKYLRHPLGLEMDNDFGRELLDHEHLKVEESDILRIAKNLRQFWVSFPERVFADEPEAVPS
ncbi:MAG TPA: hypothetical protein ENH27_00580 [Rhizobiales bacterium]|nr:hypothetical protein [Hyphomicrobiales bacterium]